MDEFRKKSLEGEWWLPHKPQEVFRGQLTIGEDNRGVLSLRGAEEHLHKLPMSETRPTFFGRLTADYSYDATVFEAVMKRGPSHTHPRDPSKETAAIYQTNAVLVSEHVPTQDDALYDGVILKLTGLESWCDATGLTGRHVIAKPAELATGTIQVHFHEQATPKYDVGSGITLRILSEYDGPFYFEDAKQVTLKERNSIELIFAEPRSINQVIQEQRIWQNFLTFALRQASYADEVFLLRNSAHGYRRVGLMLSGRRMQELWRRSHRDAVFRQVALGDRAENCFKRWRAQHNRIDLAILIFSGAAHQDSVYVHTNLLTYLQALEVLHRELYRADRFPNKVIRNETLAALRAAIPASLDASLQKELSESIQFIGAVTLLDRLKQLFALYPRSLAPLFRRGEADMVQLKDVRNFLTHYGEKKTVGKDMLWSRELLVLKEKARLFLEICLLGTMGMSDEEIVELMQNIEPYLDVRMEVSIVTANEYLRSIEDMGRPPNGGEGSEN